jgi:hypothetical protein
MTAVEYLEKEIFRKYHFLLQKLNCEPLEQAINQAKEMEKKKAHEYAEDAIRCYRLDMKILNFEDWIKL